MRCSKRAISNSTVRTIVVVAFFVVGTVHADDIYFKDGRIFKNARILEDVGTWIRVETSKGLTKFKKDGIVKIEPKKYDPNLESKFVHTNIEPSSKFSLSNNEVASMNGFYIGGSLPYRILGGEFDGETALTG